MNKDDADREKKLKMIIDRVKLYDAPLGDQFEQAYTDPIATVQEKEKFISVMRRSAMHDVKISEQDIQELAMITAEILVTRKILNNFQKKS